MTYSPKVKPLCHSPPFEFELHDVLVEVSPSSQFLSSCHNIAVMHKLDHYIMYEDDISFIRFHPHCEIVPNCDFKVAAHKKT